ncbi:KAR9-domain-containing protein [Coniochaeta sp. PMI_546]|nr:KAR9-domain-containing protein [Coniochaeta sp. PMI_546]
MNGISASVSGSSTAHYQRIPEQPAGRHDDYSQPHDPLQQRHHDPVLTFSAVPDELFQLPFGSHDSNSALTLTTPDNHQHQHTTAGRSKSSTPKSPANDNSPNINTPSSTTTISSSSPYPPQPRKPSPGLAARLKALGFGTARSKSPPPPASNDRVGRLPEEQIRRLDQGHQSSSSNPVVERRGRPWKGIARIPSRSSLKPSNILNRTDSEEDVDTCDAPLVTDGDGDGDATADPKLDFLPEIEASKPLDMDTHKYRLPDHTNGNGVKAQRETREEHLARDTRPPKSDDVPPPPPAKDTPPMTTPNNGPQQPDVFNPDSESYFNPLGLQRPGSIYTLSRASFANQLAQLTSLQLPDAESLSSKVSAIPTAQAATRALIGAAEQIRGWIHKATEVIGGLESEDDVEWAAAGGREGVEEVENAIVRFEELINVYVSAIEELQSRRDIASVSTDDLNRAVAQMEGIMDEWTTIRRTLHSVKGQVEIAMEWEELWNNVLGDIQNEMEELIRLVFEMEERRHKSILAVANGDGVDIGDLETIVEETPPAAARLQAANNRFSLPAFPASPSSPSPGATPTISQDDSSLLSLFARMQPLRASLDFLPMRLSVFEARAERIFPTACEELEMRRSGLDASYRKLEKDAESLRKELGEDRWVIVFRGAGRQAQKMYESVERSVSRLKEAVDAGMHLTNQPMMSKKIESYDAKKTHYGPAIERVLAIIDKGVKDRLTVNGEILRLNAEMQAKWEELKDRMSDMDMTLDELQTDKKSQQLRDSISSMLSNDRSTVGSGHDTPGSSPPSSVIMQSLGFPKPASTLKTAKQRSTSGGSHLPQPASRRLSSLPTPANQITRKPLTQRMSTIGTPPREGSATPTGNRGIPRPNSVVGNRPRWNGSTNTSDVDTGHNFKPLTLTTPSPYAKTTPNTVRSVSSLTPASSELPMRSPLSRASSASPMPETTPSKPTHSKLSFRERLTSPGPATKQTLAKPPPRLASQSSMSALANRRASMQPPRPLEESPDATPRPASSLATSSRRTSMLPQPKSKTAATGRESPQAVAGARFAMRQNTHLFRFSSSSWSSSALLELGLADLEDAPPATVLLTQPARDVVGLVQADEATIADGLEVQELVADVQVYSTLRGCYQSQTCHRSDVRRPMGCDRNCALLPSLLILSATKRSRARSAGVRPTVSSRYMRLGLASSTTRTRVGSTLFFITSVCSTVSSAAPS